MGADPKKGTSDRTPTSASQVFGRLIWVFFGPLTLMLPLMSIVARGKGWFSGLDLAYFMVLVLMIWRRWKEVRSGLATTAYGEPATREHFRRYVSVVVPLAIVVWGIANALGNHVWKKA